MRLISRIALVAYTMAGIASIVLGAIYVIRTEFMPYHAEAVGADWASLPSGTRALISALMNVVGVAWFVVGTLVLVLVMVPFRAGENWSRWTIPIVIMVLYGSIVVVTLQVQYATGAQTPWMINALAAGTGLIGLLFDRPWKRG